MVPKTRGIHEFHIYHDDRRAVITTEEMRIVPVRESLISDPAITDLTLVDIR